MPSKSSYSFSTLVSSSVLAFTLDDGIEAASQGHGVGGDGACHAELPVPVVPPVGANVAGGGVHGSHSQLGRCL